MSDTALLEAILVELRGLRRDVQQAGRGPLKRLSAADSERLQVLIPAIAVAAGGREFTVAELMTYARSSLKGASTLLEALARVAGPWDAGLPRRVGALLKAWHASGEEFDGRRIEQIGVERNAVVWVIRPDVSQQLPATHARARGRDSGD